MTPTSEKKVLAFLKEIATRDCDTQQGADWEILMWWGQEAEALITKIEPRQERGIRQ